MEILWCEANARVSFRIRLEGVSGVSILLGRKRKGRKQDDATSLCVLAMPGSAAMCCIPFDCAGQQVKQHVAHKPACTLHEMGLGYYCRLVHLIAVRWGLKASGNTSHDFSTRCPKEIERGNSTGPALSKFTPPSRAV